MWIEKAKSSFESGLFFFGRLDIRLELFGLFDQLEEFRAAAFGVVAGAASSQLQHVIQRELAGVLRAAQLHAEGGQGAAKDMEPFLCCYENGGES